MARKWLRELDLIQIKASLWQGDDPLSISRQFLVTQSTISAIKHGRLHPESEWPDGSNGPIPAYKETELLRQKRLGMLRRSEIATGRGHMVRDTHLRMPPPVEQRRTEKEIWWGAHKDAEKEDGSKYTHEELEQAWLIEEKERKDKKDEINQKRMDEQARAEAERVRSEHETSTETPEEKSAWEADKRRRYALSHLWGPRGKLIFENLVQAQLTDEQVGDLISSDVRARANKDLLEDFIRTRREALGGVGEGREVQETGKDD